MAEVLDVSLDCLVDYTSLELHKRMIQGIQEGIRMCSKFREHVIAKFDAFIKQTKLQGVLQ